MTDPRELDPRLFRASALAAPRTQPAASDRVPPNGGAAWLPAGRLVELTGGLDGAPTSLAVAQLADAQRTGAIAAWLQPERGPLFPPDLAANGVDLDALTVVHVPVRTEPAREAGRRAPRGRTPTPTATVGHDLPKAAELLLRSGAFDLLVLDLRPRAPRPGAWLGRLQALARTHTTTVLLLSDVRAPIEAGSTATLRLSPRRRRERTAFVVATEVVRDKLHAVTAPPVAVRPGPIGLG